MTASMQFQVALFFIAVIVCVAWTRMVYHDGVMRQIRRLRRHCMMHAAMISGVSFWAMSIGFNLHHASMATIHHQANVIQHLATRRTNLLEDTQGVANQIAFMDDGETVQEHGKTYQVTTPGGITVQVSSPGRSAGNSLLHGTAGHDRRGGTGRYLGAETPERDDALHGLSGLARRAVVER